MKRIIVITGTPASGKTTISKRLSKAMKGSELIRANDLVKELHLYNGRDGGGELIADMKGLRAAIGRRIKSSNAKTVILEGHLLCDIRIKGATAVVVREHLNTLLSRMKKRRYSKAKIEGNLVSEAIDYCGVNAMANYGSVYEVEGGSGAVKEIMDIINGKGAEKEIDMLGELNGIARKLGKAVL